MLWRPFLALIGLMVITGVAGRARADGPARRARRAAGGRVGDAAVRAGVRAEPRDRRGAQQRRGHPAADAGRRAARARLYPDRPDLLVPFAFAVFMAAGVAPFVTSNPMNMVVAGVAGIDFNEYAVRMVPVAVAGSVVTFVVLRLVFARELRGGAAGGAAAAGAAVEPAQWQALVLVLVVVVAYPVFALAGVEVFAVALAAARSRCCCARATGGAGRSRSCARTSPGRSSSSCSGCSCWPRRCATRARSRG